MRTTIRCVAEEAASKPLGINAESDSAAELPTNFRRDSCDLIANLVYAEAQVFCACNAAECLRRRARYFPVDRISRFRYFSLRPADLTLFFLLPVVSGSSVLSGKVFVPQRIRNWLKRWIEQNAGVSHLGHLLKHPRRVRSS